MGICIGCIGMLYSDWEWLDFDEFHHIYKAWHDMKEAEEQSEWERMRMLATICISPHVKHAPKPTALLPFPWEKKVKVHSEPVGKEEAKRRFEDIVNKLKNS